MNEQAIIDAVTRLSTPLLEEKNLIPVDIEFAKGPAGWVLRLCIEKKGGRVSLDECAEVSRELGVILDVENTIPVPHHLEVSSPGLTRQLKKESDYTVFAGRLVKVHTKMPVGNKMEFTGTLLGLEGDKVKVMGADHTWEIPLSGISKAHLDF